MNIINFDIEKHIKLYKEKIDTEIPSIDDYINLILLYWSISFDYGLESYCITNNIFSEKEILEFSVKVNNIFDIALKEYPIDDELLFWKMYIKENDIYSPCLYKEEIINLSKRDTFLLPYFYLYVQCNELIEKKLRKFKKELLEEETSYKKYYILSYLEGISI